MKKLQKSIIIFLIGTLTFSCSKWVEVKPIDRLGEDQLFVNSAGFLKALNGVYVEMTHEHLYGQHMSAGVIDVLAQYYYIRSSTHVFEKFTLFTYTDIAVKTAFDNTWSKAYELIANCNIILEKCGDMPSTLLPDPHYAIIKGEALALRAMLHFDMLRLFGPIHNEENKSKASIPYVNKTGYEVLPLSSSEQAIEQVISDLQDALQLLSADPIRTLGVRNYSNAGGANDFHFRQYRLNYYAVKALLARAYLWKGDQPEALKYAEAVLDEVQNPDKNTFPKVTFAAATHVERPDRMFSTEVMFAMYDMRRSDMYRNLFDVSLQPVRKLSFSEGTVTESRVNTTYDDSNDYRRRIWQSVSTGTTVATTNMKFADIVDAPGRYMIPLIRLSELLLIAAECHSDLDQAVSYFNELRTMRNAVSLFPSSKSILKQEIGKEFRREMLGEGQMFFFYKRNAYQTIPSSANLASIPEKTMVLNNYTVPLPDSETAQRQ